MDPASAIGVASAVLGIINLIAKNVASLNDFQARYNVADLKFSLLIGQLSTIRAALKQIANLLGSDLGFLQDPDLIDDFSTSLGGVEAVVKILGDKISLVQRNATNTLTIRSRIKFMWDEKTVDYYLDLLNNQFHALNLLLTALQCRTTPEQTNLLQSSESRHVFNRVKDDTSSLLWLRDADSVNTHRSTGTEDLGTVDATFTFDPEIFSSKVYRMATKSSMIHALFSAKRDSPNDATSLAPRAASLRSIGTSVTGKAASGADNTVAVDRCPSIHGIQVRTEIEISHSENVDMIRESAPQTTSRLAIFSPSIPETIENADANLQSELRPDSPTLSITDRNYTIHTQKTLRTLPRVSEPRRTPPQSTHRRRPWSLSALEDAGPRKEKGDLSAYRQLVSFQRSGRENIPRPHKPGDTVVGRLDKVGIKVLVLGISESGKSTLQKSMKVTFENDDEQWRLSYRSSICMSLVQSLSALASKTIWYKKVNMGTLDENSSLYERMSAKSCRVINDWIRFESQEVDDTYSFPPSVASAVIDLSKDSDIRHRYDQMMLRPKIEGRNRFITDCTKHFMNSALRIVDPKYIPTVQDVLWTRKKSAGMHESRYVLENALCRFVDFGGTRAERRKWSLECRDVNTIIFTLDVSCYDQVLIEDAATGEITGNRMTEQLLVWDSLVQSECFEATNFIVVFTKTDRVTSSKLQASPFYSLFPGYSGMGDSLEDVLQYLAWRLDIASKGRTTGRLVFCNAGSIWDSPTNMAEVAVRALTEVENF